MLGLVFPGQGVQRAGMGAGLFERFAGITAEADEILGWSVPDLCASGDTTRLTDTTYAQPAIFLVNALGALARTEDGAPAGEVCAGHSLGEFNALVAAGILGLLDGLRLVRDRALAMAKVRGGGMIAVSGLPGERVEQILRGSGLGQVHVANRNSDRQTTVSGDTAQLGLASRVLKRGGATQVVPLRVSGPFHSPLMAPARVAFARTLQGVRFTPGTVPVVSSVTGDLFRPEEAAQVLTRQLVTPVEWVCVVRRMRELGVTTFEEVGGTVLTGMIKAVR
ncbi:MAG: [acyl-carrier-protein] S-malonyltransferase [Actinomycetota bacterium]|nr:[acyl-carrier-protein] S-malonyltransferase [Actinomycetota bacterium]